MDRPPSWTAWDIFVIVATLAAVVVPLVLAYLNPLFPPVR